VQRDRERGFVNGSLERDSAFPARGGSASRGAKSSATRWSAPHVETHKVVTLALAAHLRAVTVVTK